MENLIQKHSKFHKIPESELEWIKNIPAGDRILETEFKYTEFGTAPEGYDRHHIIPYKSCIYYRDECEYYSPDWHYWNDLACDKDNNSIDLPEEIHIELHGRLSKLGYGKQDIIPKDEFEYFRKLTFKLIDEITEKITGQVTLDNY